MKAPASRPAPSFGPGCCSCQIPTHEMRDREGERPAAEPIAAALRPVVRELGAPGEERREASADRVGERPGLEPGQPEPRVQIRLMTSGSNSRTRIASTVTAASVETRRRAFGPAPRLSRPMLGGTSGPLTVRAGAADCPRARGGVFRAVVRPRGHTRGKTGGKAAIGYLGDEKPSSNALPSTARARPRVAAGAPPPSLPQRTAATKSDDDETVGSSDCFVELTIAIRVKSSLTSAGRAAPRLSVYQPERRRGRVPRAPPTGRLRDTGGAGASAIESGDQE